MLISLEKELEKIRILAEQRNLSCLLRPISKEAVRLERLVDALRTLSLADAGELSLTPQAISPERLLQEVASLYRADESLHRADGGSGLGLAKSIVLAHGGGIRAESAPGEGLTVIITLPVKS